MPKQYTTISLPTEMIKYIDKLLQDPKIIEKYGYSSRTELIKAAISKHIKELDEERKFKLES